MTIASNVSKSPVYTGTGLVSTYAYPFKIPTAEELLVRMSDTDGLERSLILTNEYSVTGVGNSTGGDVVLVNPLPAGYKLVILRNMDFIQETDLDNQGGFYPEVIESAFDRLTMQNQQMKEVIDRLESPNATETTPPGVGSYLVAMEEALASVSTEMDRKVSDAETAEAAAEAARDAAIAAKNDVVGNTPHGFDISIGTDTEHDITISAGSIPDSTFTYNMSLAAPITKQIDAAWAEGTNLGGYASGSALAGNTWYHVFAIYNPTSGATDAGFDTSITATNLLEAATGFTEYRYIGSVLTDSSSNIIPFINYPFDNYTEWQTPILDYISSSLPASKTLITLRSPLGIITNVCFNFVSGAPDRSYIYYSDYVDDLAPSLANSPLGNASDQQSSSGGYADGQLKIKTNTNSEIAVRSSASSGNIKISTVGWQYNRGW